MDSPVMDPQLETVTVLHHPITWSMYSICAVANDQAHIASPMLHSGSNIVSDSRPCYSDSIDSPTLEIWLFENPSLRSWITLKSRSYSGSNNLSTHIHFIQCQLTLPFLGCNYFTIPWKSKVKTLPQGHIMVQHPIDSHPFHSMSNYPAIPGIQLFQNSTFKIQYHGHRWGSKSQNGPNFLSTHILFISCQSVLPFLKHGFFKIMGINQVQRHKLCSTSYRFTPLSFHVNRPHTTTHTRHTYALDTAFSKCDL